MMDSKQLPIITVLSNFEDNGYKQLKRSAEHFGWEFIPIITEWKGFGTKIKETRKYLLEHPDIQQFIFLDAYDTFVLGTAKEFLYKYEPYCILFNGEKNCWPDKKYMGFFHHEAYISDWMYLNSGMYAATRDYYLSVTKDVTDGVDDQRYFTEKKILLSRQDRGIRIDSSCEIFQSIAFESPGDFEYRWDRLFNLKTRSFPIFIHGNGKTDLTNIYGLVK